jgi:epoxyqueuosine reductase
VRISGAEPDPLTRERLETAFARGDFQSWSYDAAYAQAATDAATLLEGARSVICIALAYATPALPFRPLAGRVSNYAWGADYHRRVRAILDRVAETVASLGGRSKVACDEMPIAERAFAARSGLAWIGKHTNAIVPGLGSYVFLGELVTTLVLEPDPPLKKTCGACVRCVDVCPTSALRGDYTIDANRCISDLTQRPGIIPRELRTLIGDWVWGCDLCQDICPPVRRAGFAGNEDFAPVERRARPGLVEMLRLTSAGYKRDFERSAMGWRGAALLRRNAAIALGNALDRSTVPYLGRSMESDPNPIVRGHVAWALGRIGSPPAFAILRRSLERETDAFVIAEIRATLEPFARGEAFWKA